MSSLNQDGLFLNQFKFTYHAYGIEGLGKGQKHLKLVIFSAPFVFD